MLAEKAVFEQIHNHMITHSPYPEFQSSYRQNLSTKKALVKVTNDTLRKINYKEVTLLVMLDLNAVFDTVTIKKREKDITLVLEGNEQENTVVIKKSEH